MRNYFYDLPNEIQTMIYEYDRTYHDQYREVLEGLKRYRLYKSKFSNMYIMFDNVRKFYWRTSSLQDPVWEIRYNYRPFCKLDDRVLLSFMEEIKIEDIDYPNI